MPSTDTFDLSTGKAAEILGVHPRTLKRWVRDGKLHTFRTPGGWLRFRRSDLDAFLEANTRDEAAS